MSQTIFAKPLHDNMKPENNYVRIKNKNDYSSSSIVIPQKEYRIYEQRAVRNVDLFKNSIEILVDQIRDTDNHINLKVSQFLSENYGGTLEHAIIEDHDSDFHIIEIKNDDLPLEEVFDLADNLNDKAFEEELGFIVIAGV